MILEKFSVVFFNSRNSRKLELLIGRMPEPHDLFCRIIFFFKWLTKGHMVLDLTEKHVGTINKVWGNDSKS